MSDTRGGRVTSSMIDIRYSAVAEFRGGQEDQVNVVNTLKRCPSSGKFHSTLRDTAGGDLRYRSFW